MHDASEQIKARLHKEGSFHGLGHFLRLTELSDIATIQGLRVAIAGGFFVTMEIHHIKNLEVARFLRTHPPNTPRPVYSVCTQTPDPSLPDLSPSSWAGRNHMPLVDADILGAFSKKEDANEYVRDAVKEWKNTTAGNRARKATLFGPESRVEKSVVVQFDDGKKSFDDGSVGY